jgi:hypothetical protein
MRIRDPEIFWPWIRDTASGMEKIRIRDKFPGSATPVTFDGMYADVISENLLISRSLFITVYFS